MNTQQSLSYHWDQDYNRDKFQIMMSSHGFVLINSSKEKITSQYSATQNIEYNLYANKSTQTVIAVISVNNRLHKCIYLFNCNLPCVSIVEAFYGWQIYIFSSEICLKRLQFTQVFTGTFSIFTRQYNEILRQRNCI